MGRSKLGVCLTLLLCAVTTAFAATRFVDRQKRPIDEIRILGTHITTSDQVLRALEMGPDDFENAVTLMRGVVPYFSHVKWDIREENGKRIAEITVVERFPRRPKLFDPDGNFSLNSGLNRVQGSQVGARFQLTNQPDKSIPPRGKLFASGEYGFGNGLWNYELGGELSWGWLKRQGLTLSGSLYRATEVMDKEVLPSDREQFLTALLYAGDWRDYYLREGQEASVLWKPAKTPHSLRITLYDEEHSGMEVTSRWSLFGQDNLEDLFNRPSTPGRLRSVAATYGYERPGWRNTLDVEHADPEVSSDFDFTRVRATLRHYQRQRKNLLDFRVMAGSSRGTLPFQRQFGLGGPGTLRGYGDDEFIGNHAAMVNVDYRRSLLHAFVDAGQVVNDVDDFDPTKAKVNVGVGVHFLDFFRLNLSQALEKGRDPRLDFRWSRMF